MQKYIYSESVFNILYIEIKQKSWKISFGQNKPYKKMPSVFFRELKLITVLLLIWDFYMSWSTRLISLKLYVGFSIFDSVLFLLKFIWSSERNTDLCFNEESDYSEENKSHNEDFCSTILQSFQFDLNKKKRCGNESHDKTKILLNETKHIYAWANNLLHIRIGNLNWCKWGHCKNKARETDCLCCREVDAMLIASVKIPEREGSISPSSFYGQLLDY